MSRRVTTLFAMCCIPFFRDVKSGTPACVGQTMPSCAPPASPVPGCREFVPSPRIAAARRERSGFALLLHTLPRATDRQGDRPSRGHSGARQTLPRTHRASAARGGCSNSCAIRSLVFQENSGESPVGRIFVGTMNIRPSGISTRRPASQNVGFAVGIIRSDELIAQAQSAAKIAAQGFSRDEGIRAGFDHASIDVLRCGARRQGAERIRRERNQHRAPLRRCSSSAKAAASPEIPPPMIAMRFMMRLPASGFPAERGPESMLLNKTRQILHVFDRRLRQDPVPEIEDVTWPPSG